MVTPIIVWLVDVPGWAYDNRARRIERALPNFRHQRYFNIEKAVKLCWNPIPVMDKADVIVCPDPRLLRLFPDEIKRKIVQNLNAIKIF